MRIVGSCVVVRLVVVALRILVALRCVAQNFEDEYSVRKKITYITFLLELKVPGQTNKGETTERRI